MFTVIVVLLVALAIAAGLWLALRGGSGRPRAESLGAPPDQLADEPLIRTESRHFDTPSGADIERPGGREHPGSS